MDKCDVCGDDQDLRKVMFRAQGVNKWIGRVAPICKACRMDLPDAATFPWPMLKVLVFNLHDSGTTIFTYVKRWVDGKVVWRGT